MIEVRRGLFPSYSYLPRLTQLDKPNTSTLLGLLLPYLLALSNIGSYQHKQTQPALRMLGTREGGK